MVDPKMVDPSRPEQLWFFDVFWNIFGYHMVPYCWQRITFWGNPGSLPIFPQLLPAAQELLATHLALALPGEHRDISGIYRACHQYSSSKARKSPAFSCNPSAWKGGRDSCAIRNVSFSSHKAHVWLISSVVSTCFNPSAIPMNQEPKISNL